MIRKKFNIMLLPRESRCFGWHLGLVEYVPVSASVGVPFMCQSCANFNCIRCVAGAINGYMRYVIIAKVRARSSENPEKYNSKQISPFLNYKMANLKPWAN